MTESKPDQLEHTKAAPASKELEHQIEAVIKPWTNTKKRPSLSIHEMVVMCLLLCEPLSKRDLMTKLAEHFGWVRDFAITTLFSSMTGSWHQYYFERPKELSELRDTLERIHCDFSSPIVVCEQDGEDMLTVRAVEARIFLRNHILPFSSKPFPFMRLPTELRLNIYQMVLCLPKSGVRPRSTGDLSVWTKDYQAPSALDFEQERSYLTSPTFSAGGVQSHLSLLKTSKQIYQEAIPVFYAENNFVLDDVSEALYYLRRFAPSRLEHVRHISFIWDSHEKVKDAVELFVILGSMSGLRHIDIRFRQKQWEDQSKRVYNSGGIFKPAKLPGFNKLLILCASKQVTLYGDCDALRDALKSQPVDEVQGKKKRVNKRKASGAGQGKAAGGGAKGKKVKRAAEASEA